VLGAVLRGERAALDVALVSRVDDVERIGAVVRARVQPSWDVDDLRTDALFEGFWCVMLSRRRGFYVVLADDRLEVRYGGTTLDQFEPTRYSVVTLDLSGLDDDAIGDWLAHVFATRAPNRIG
jgi:hypothetical protein